MKNLYIYGLYVLMAAILFCGCIKDDRETINNNADEVEVEIAYSIPGMEFSVTRGMGFDLDHFRKLYITSLSSHFVLVYEVQPDNSELFAFYRGVTVITQENDGSGTIRVNLPKSKNGEKYTFDFFFNSSSSSIVNILNGERGTERETLRKKLTTNLRSSSVTANTYTPYTATYGNYLNAVEIEHNKKLPALKLLKMVALFDIGVNLDNDLNAQGLPNFVLKEVRLNGGTPNRCLIPEPALVTSDYRVTAASIPPNEAKTTSSATVIVSANQISAADQRSIGNVFLYEHSQTTTYASAAPTDLCLILRGDYTDEFGSLLVDQYYRVDITDPDDPSVLTDIIRNHRYLVNIVGVTGPGSSTVPNAVATGHKNIITKLVVSEEGDINYLAYNNKYYIGVSDIDIYDEYGAGITRPIKVKTNWYSSSSVNGWEVSRIMDGQDGTDASGWISVSPSSGTGVTSSNFPVFNVDVKVEPNPGPDFREAVIRFRTRGTDLYIDVWVYQEGA